MAKNPVCGMVVDEKGAELKASYKGKTYYFCYAVCQEQFKAKPEKFVK